MGKRVLGIALAANLYLGGYAVAATQVVNALSSSFSPANVTINTGDSVRWMNVSGSHTTTSGTGPGDPQSGNLWDANLNFGSPQFARRFNTPGVFEYYCKFHFPGMTGTITVNTVTGVFDDVGEGTVNPRTDLFQNVPNPFNASTLIGFTLRAAGPVHLAVYNILGHPVRTLVQGEMEPGGRFIEWDGADDQRRDLPSGVYFYRLSTRDGTETRKMVLLR